MDPVLDYYHCVISGITSLFACKLKIPSDLYYFISFSFMYTDIAKPPSIKKAANNTFYYLICLN